VLQDLVPATPFKKANVPAVKLTREDARSRRLHPGEGERLVAAADPYMRDLITAALETACRKGELLSLQWHQVRDDLSLPACKTKTKKARRVPISSVLATVLAARRHDPSGQPLPPQAYVFGDELGRPRKSIKSAWDLARLRGAGHTPTWARQKNRGGKLTAESRGLLREIDLHFHDLRREGASRWLDGGVALTTIQKWLGHATLAQTATYLAATAGGDAEAMRAFEQAEGRLAPLPQIAPFSRSDRPQGERSIHEDDENIRKNTVLH
jgi:integrase